MIEYSIYLNLLKLYILYIILYIILYYIICVIYGISIQSYTITNFSNRNTNFVLFYDSWFIKILFLLIKVCFKINLIIYY